MKRNLVVALYFITALTILFSCDDEFQLMKNIKVGNPDLAITGFSPPAGVLREDTLTIYGSAFNPLTYQNQIFFPLVSSKELWVNEQGEVTDSVIYRVTKYAHNPALVVDSSPDSIKVIIPTDAVNGPVRVGFGVDTVISPMNYNLLTTELRPKIQSFVPTFGPPGITLNMEVRDGFLEVERVVVAFGSYIGHPYEISGSEGLSSVFINIPNIFAGPVDLRVGKKLESDTLWSTPINFGILPVEKNVIPLVVTFDGNDTGGSQAVYGDVGYGEQVDGVTNLVELEKTEDTDSPGGIAYNSENENVYWLRNNGGTACTLFQGNVNAKKADNYNLNFPQLFSDVVFAKAGTKNYLYLAGKVIRRIEVNNQLASVTNIKLYGDPNTQSVITNLKKVGNTFYWVDNALKKIVKGELAANGSSLINVASIYDEADGLLTPQAMAIHEDDIFLSVYDITGYRIVKGSVDGTEPLTMFQEYEKIETQAEANNLIQDLEVDHVNNYLYWSDKNNEANGVFRKLLNNPGSTPKIIYQFPFAQYFDLIQE